MAYVVLMFAGGITGLMLSGPGGAFFGVAVGFLVGSWHVLTAGSDADTSGGSYTASAMDSLHDDRLAFDNDLDAIGSWNDGDFSSNHHVNPATGLPMTGGGTAGFDVAGNPYGVDWSNDGLEIGLSPSSEDMFSSSELF